MAALVGTDVRLFSAEDLPLVNPNALPNPPPNPLKSLLVACEHQALGVLVEDRGVAGGVLLLRPLLKPLHLLQHPNEGI